MLTNELTMTTIEQQMIDGLKVNRPTPPNQGPIVAPGTPCKKHPGFVGFKHPADTQCKACRWIRLQYLYFKDKLECGTELKQVTIIRYARSRRTKENYEGY